MLNWYLPSNFFPKIAIPETERYSESYQKKKVNSNLAIKPLMYDGDLSKRCTIAIEA